MKDAVEQALEKYGFPKNEDWYVKYKSLRCNSRKKGNECLLTFSEYLRLAKRAGLTSASQISNATGGYQMARKGDTGDYEWGNCRFVVRDQNVRERVKNGGSRRQAEKVAVTFIAVSPTGKRYKATDLKQFCSVHDLGASHMSKVMHGHRAHHKGWTARLERTNDV